MKTRKRAATFLLEEVSHRGGLATRVDAVWAAPDLLERLGGREVLERVVDGLYDRIDADPMLKPIFLGRARGEHRHQKYFFEEWMGGEPRYRRRVAGFGNRMLHRRFAIDRRTAGRWLSHMVASLRQEEVPPPLIREIMSQLGPMAHALASPDSVPWPARLDVDDDAAFEAAVARDPDLLRHHGEGARALLLEAVQGGNAERIERLLRHGVDVNIPSLHGELLVSAWSLAKVSGNFEILGLLEAHGALPDVFSAAYVGDLDLLSSLVDRTPELLDVEDPAMDHRGVTALHHAVHGGSAEAVIWLLKRDCRLPPDAADLLARAAVQGRSDVVEAFFNRGVAGEAVPIGAWARHEQVARRLIEAGARVDRPRSAWLHFCGRGSPCGDDPDLIAALLALGVDREAVFEGKGALHLAIGAGFLGIAARLLDQGFDVDARDARGDTPLAHVAWADPGADRDGLTELLLDRGADPRQPNDAGLSPLDRARALRGESGRRRRRVLEGAAARLGDGS